MKTPIKDSLNFKSINLIKELIPANSIVSSYLLFSGAVDFGLAADKRHVISHTDRYCIYEFWNCINDDPKKVADIARYVYNLLCKVPLEELEKMFIDLQKDWHNVSPDYYVRAAYFFLLNQISETGNISSGKMNLRKFNPISLHTLQNFKIDNLHFSYEEDKHFIETLDQDECDYLLLPVGKYSHNLFEYGKNKGPETTTVYHDKLFKSLRDIDTKWIVIYKNHLEVFDMYKDYNVFMVDKYGRRTIKKDKCEEIIIANF